MKVVKAFELKIDEPCTENFDAMPRTACGAFCSKCSKEVIDFTELTDIELTDILKKKLDACGMYRPDQVNKFYRYEEVIPERRPVRFWLSVLTFVSILFSKEASAQQENKPIHQKENTAGKNLINGRRIYCRLQDRSGIPIANVKITAGNETVFTDSSGKFDINNPFDRTTEVVTLLFDNEGNYVYEQIHAVDVKDAPLVFILDRAASSIPARDIAQLATHGRVNDRRGDLNVMGGMPSRNTVTYLDGIMVRGNAPEVKKEKKPNFFQRLFGKKAK